MSTPLHLAMRRKRQVSFKLAQIQASYEKAEARMFRSFRRAEKIKKQFRRYQAMLRKAVQAMRIEKEKVCQDETK